MQPITRNVMRAIRELRPNGYGATVQQAIERAEGRAPSLGRIYVEFMRLEEAGMVETREVAGSPERGGRRKLVAVLTEAGKTALEREDEG